MHDRVAVVTSIAAIGHVREVGLLRVSAVALEAAAGKDRLGRFRFRAVVEVVDADDIAIRIHDVAARGHRVRLGLELPSRASSAATVNRGDDGVVELDRGEDGGLGEPFGDRGHGPCGRELELVRETPRDGAE